jgi:hypothetical protein
MFNESILHSLRIYKKYLFLIMMDMEKNKIHTLIIWRKYLKICENAKNRNKISFENCSNVMLHQCFSKPL